jgi:hypothetical protein
VRLLCECGVDVAVADGAGRTALHGAMKRCGVGFAGV